MWARLIRTWPVTVENDTIIRPVISGGAFIIIIIIIMYFLSFRDL